MDYQFMDEQLTLFSVEEFVFQDVLEFREDEISLKRCFPHPQFVLVAWNLQEKNTSPHQISFSKTDDTFFFGNFACLQRNQIIWLPEVFLYTLLCTQKTEMALGKNQDRSSFSQSLTIQYLGIPNITFSI